jgi:uncharacterized membrane-anchored protein
MRRLIFALSSLGVFAALGWQVVDAEALIRDGDVVLMQLAPADPRSLIQGDYMRLAWAIERNTVADVADPGRRLAVVGLDERRVASFRRIDMGEPRAADERLFAIKPGRNGGGIAIEPHSFLFQEGRAADFAQARYGVFRVAPSGRHLLVGLAGADGATIEPRRDPPRP